jgi:hypothetical protein
VLALLFLGLFWLAMGIGRGDRIELPDLFAASRPTSRRRARSRCSTEPARAADHPVDQGGGADPRRGAGHRRLGRGAAATRHNEAGWFDGGPTPGQFGPALIVGHADTRTGRRSSTTAQAEAGQRIEVLRADRSVAVFEVNSVEHFNKGKLPDPAVYGDYSRRRCG